MERAQINIIIRDEYKSDSEILLEPVAIQVYHFKKK